MSDPRIAALAEALRSAIPELDDLMHGPVGETKWGAAATAILAALPPDWCGHDPLIDAEVAAAGFCVCGHEPEFARHRRIEEAARALLGREYGWNGDMPYWNFTGPAYHEVRALRAALEEKP